MDEMKAVTCDVGSVGFGCKWRFYRHFSAFSEDEKPFGGH
jgi:hypothetical protein